MTKVLEIIIRSEENESLFRYHETADSCGLESGTHQTYAYVRYQIPREGKFSHYLSKEMYEYFIDSITPIEVQYAKQIKAIKAEKPVKRKPARKAVKAIDTAELDALKTENRRLKREIAELKLQIEAETRKEVQDKAEAVEMEVRKSLSFLDMFNAPRIAGKVII